jgi:hypothetical protein
VGSLSQNALRQLFSQLGINLEAPNKTVAYNDLTGIVMVRAAAPDLEIVQAAMETLGGLALGQSAGGAVGFGARAAGYGGGGFGGGRTGGGLGSRGDSALDAPQHGISVLGEVKTPNRYAIPSEEKWTLLDALAAAGGVTKHAQEKIELIRRGKTSTYRFGDLLKASDPAKVPILEPGDVIFVPERTF